MSGRRLSRDEANEALHPIIVWAAKYEIDFTVGGSIRRQVERVGDVDVVVWGEPLDGLILPCEYRPSTMGPSTSRGTLAGVRVDWWSVLDPAARGAFLWFITGPKELNIAMRAKAMRRGLKLTQYGLFDKRTNARVPGTETEKGLAEALGWRWMEPHEREEWRA